MIQQQYTSSTAVQEALNSLQGVQLLHPSLIASYKVGCSDWNAHFVKALTPVAAEHTSYADMRCIIMRVWLSMLHVRVWRPGVVKSDCCYAHALRQHIKCLC